MTSAGSEEVLVIRRSAGKTASWALGCACAAILLGLGLFQRNMGAKIIGGVALLGFGLGALGFLHRLRKPRDLLRVGPDGIDQLAVRPHATIAWDEITDIRVIQRGYNKNVGIKVRDMRSSFHRPVTTRWCAAHGSPGA